MPKGES
jgi:hypothetical protein